MRPSISVDKTRVSFQAVVLGASFITNVARWFSSSTCVDSKVYHGLKSICTAIAAMKTLVRPSTCVDKTRVSFRTVVLVASFITNVAHWFSSSTCVDSKLFNGFKSICTAIAAMKTLVRPSTGVDKTLVSLQTVVLIASYVTNVTLWFSTCVDCDTIK